MGKPVKRASSAIPGRKPIKKQKTESTDGTTGDAEAPQKTGIMYQVNLKYAELTNTKKERNSVMLIEQMIEMIRSSKMSLQQVGCSGDGSRAFQACLKWGDRRHRNQILDLFEPVIPELVADEKGGALVQKMLKYCPKVLEAGNRNSDGTRKEAGKAELALQTKIVERIVSPVCELGENKLTKLFFSKFGCKNLDALVNAEHVKAKFKNQVLNMIQVPKKLRLMNANYKATESVRKFEKEIIKTGGDSLIEFRAHMDGIVDRIVDKELLDRPITHSLLALHARLLEADKSVVKKSEKDGDDTDKNAQPTSLMKEFVDKRLPVDACPHLLQTKCGVEALMRYLGYFSAKQKKQIVKLLKGKYRDMAENNVCYVLVMRLLQIVDDTVLSKNSILQELIDAPAEVIEKKAGGDDEKLADGADEEDEEKKAKLQKEKEEKKKEEEAKSKLCPLAKLLEDSVFARKIVYSVLEQPVSRYFGPVDMEGCFDLPAPSAVKDADKRRSELRQFLITPVLKALDDLGWIHSLNIVSLKDIAMHFVTCKDESKTQLEKFRSQKTIIEENILGAKNGEEEESLIGEPGKILDLVRQKNACLSFVVMVRNSPEFASLLWEKVLVHMEVEKIAEQATWLLFNCWSNSDKKEAVVSAVKARLPQVRKSLDKARAQKPPVQRSKTFLEDLGLQ